MFTEELPDTHTEIIISTRVTRQGQKLPATPLAEAEIVTHAQIKPWLDKGYYVESFENKPWSTDPYTTQTTVFFARRLGVE